MVSVFSCLDKNIFQKSCKSLALTALVSLSIGIAFAPTLSSAQTVGPGCDPKVMRAMQLKGWMEAQREIMISQATIAKPDSVFALGCFQTFHDSYEKTVKFSKDSSYATSGVYNDAALFVAAAFSGQDLGGGHYDAGGKNSELDNCGAMMQLWTAARCSNLALPSKHLDTLQDFKSYDRGDFPTACKLATGFGDVGTPATPLGTFYGPKKDKEFVLGDKNSGAAFDDMDLFANVTAPLSQTKDKKCAAGIPTGIEIQLGSNKVPEIICPNPGCVSDGGGTPKCVAYK